MPIHFRSGELLQKGRGIMGFMKAAFNNYLMPAMSSGVKNIAKAATSKTAKTIAKTLGEQALDSSLNITKDLLHGNDLNQSLHRETGNLKRTGGNIIEELQRSRKRQKRKSGKVSKKNPPKKKNPTKKKRISLTSMRKYDR